MFHWYRGEVDSTPTYLADIFGEVFLRIMYKGHIYKAREGGLMVGCRHGWGGREWCGESGDNCTWTTIKSKINKTHRKENLCTIALKMNNVIHLIIKTLNV